jgi:hypothetical protein
VDQATTSTSWQATAESQQRHHHRHRLQHPIQGKKTLKGK